ncbi:Fructosamine kinase-domain-containing protein [Xylariaceae sp. FL0255]|nr:Fructosamine kinase-domain-containing protein [Xylariaceae sp. FL0255]
MGQRYFVQWLHNVQGLPRSPISIIWPAHHTEQKQWRFEAQRFHQVAYLGPRNGTGTAGSSGIPAALRVAIEQNRRVVSENSAKFIIAEHKWCKDTSVPERLIQYVDQGVLDKLPPGTGVQEYRRAESRTGLVPQRSRLPTDEAGRETNLFIKILQFEHGMNMVASEFRSMSRLWSIMPELVAEPIAWGSYVKNSDAHFFVCRFCEMSGAIPDLDKFPKLLAEMHKRGVSPDGKFGMPYVTYTGRNPLYFPPSESWEEYFSKGLTLVFDMEEDTHGIDQQLREMRGGIMTKVIPRLLCPLETEGRSLAPRLVHGDLWDGNASIDANTGTPKIFDGVCFYAYNEHDLGPWWAPRHKMTDKDIAEYIKCFPVSEPKGDFGGRGDSICKLRPCTLEHS